MDKYRIIIQNAYTGEMVHDDLYCGGFVLIMGRGERSNIGTFERGKILARDISEDGIADLILDDKLMGKVRKRLNHFRFWLWTPAGLWVRLKEWLKERRSVEADR